ncbi:unnamed protein product [Symbiodinium sp. KB8]|nr:unnamed protein product [Symbiodinium sp. KB8]
MASAPAAAGSAIKAVIAPSMLASDFARLADEAKDVIAKGADWLHMDVMVRPCLRAAALCVPRVGDGEHRAGALVGDGHFVPNLTLGAPIVKALRKHTDAFMDCHLMVSDPGAWVEDFHAAGASQITFHVETVGEPGACREAQAQLRLKAAVHAFVRVQPGSRDAKDPVALAKRIRELGIRAGIAVKPKTPVESVLPLLEHFDMVLIMTVEPGFGGQKFMADMMDKVRAVRAAAPTMDVQVDGGLSPATVDVAAEAGANVIVAGTAVFGAEDRAAAIAALRESVAKQC